MTQKETVLTEQVVLQDAKQFLQKLNGMFDQESAFINGALSEFSPERFYLAGGINSFRWLRDEVKAEDKQLKQLISDEARIAELAQQLTQLLQLSGKQIDVSNTLFVKNAATKMMTTIIELLKLNGTKNYAIEAELDFWAENERLDKRFPDQPQGYGRLLLALSFGAFSLAKLSAKKALRAVGARGVPKHVPSEEIMRAAKKMLVANQAIIAQQKTLVKRLFETLGAQERITGILQQAIPV
jgi:hypothetical protein